MAKEITIRLGILTRVLQRAGCVEENDRIISLEIDEQTNVVTLYVAEREDRNVSVYKLGRKEKEDLFLNG